MIIKSKLRVPALPDRLVERPRLDVLIASQVAARRLVVIQACAGAGKTTAAVASLPQIGLPAAWVTVDSTDAAPERLLAYLETALGAHMPAADTVASDALRHGVAHVEAAGLLAEAVGERPVLLVLDQVERIATSHGALDVISAVVRYAPPTMRTMLVGRRELALDLDTALSLDGLKRLDAEEFALTVAETAALVGMEIPELEPEAVIDVTGGWLTGVLFQVRASSKEPGGLVAGATGLHSYMATQVLDQLTPEEREFLIATSPLTEVTVAGAVALGQPGAAGLLGRLRAIGLPATLDDGALRMRCYPQFREYLLTLRERSTDGNVERLPSSSEELPVDDRPLIRLAEFGRPAIEVDGIGVRPRIKKSYELLAYLASRPSPEAERDELLDVLFDGRADESTRSYLRQATHRLRNVLPADTVLTFEGSRLRLYGSFRLVSDSTHVSELISGVSRDSGERLARLLDALTVMDGGEYLAGARSIWVDERREEFRGVAEDVRHEAAELLFADGDAAAAKLLALAIVRSDPYRESAWRLLMSIASAMDDEAGVVDAYRTCEQAMSEIGLTVSGATAALITELRR